MRTQNPEFRIQNSEVLVFLFSFLFWLLASGSCILSSDAFATTITADHLEHFRSENKYVATGNVRIEKDGSVLLADRAILYDTTSDAEAFGHVTFEDATTLINAERAEMNLDTKTGKLYNTIILLKDQKGGSGLSKATSSQDLVNKSAFVREGKIDYRIRSDKIEKLSDSHYYAPEATFTTCTDDPSDPDWCFRGEKVDIVVGKKLTTKNVTYRVKGLPVLYSPYLWAPLASDRETGFLFPVFGNSSTKGFQFSPSFFWAIDENKDATFYLDYYSKRGLGKGIEYRYLDFDNKGMWYLYHLKDSELNKTFYEIKGSHDHQLGDIRAFADINYVNEEDFLKEYGRNRNLRIQRFLQSSAEISVPFRNSRAYLLGQHWIDLENDNDREPQRLPELGYVVNATSVGPLLFSMTSAVTNFTRDNGPKGQRVDVNPTLAYSFGNAVRVFQSLSLRETAYNLSNSDPFDSSLHRETFEYRANALSRFTRNYASATHIVEPSFSFTFIPQTHPLPTFDSTELFNKTSQASFSLYNSLAFRRFSLASTLTQSLNFHAGDRPLAPTALSISLSGPVTLTYDMSYNFNTGHTVTMNASITTNLVMNTWIKFSE
jgi:LPS-assembly protein